jgi:hypothetical protein
LSFGLDFNLPIYKPSFYKYFTSFEKFMTTLKYCRIAPGTNFDILRDQVKRIAYKTFYGFRSHKVFSPIFTKSDISILKNLGRDKDLIVCAPDTGKGVVILNRKDYINKMDIILEDSTKFTKLRDTDPFSETIKNEDRINRCLTKLKKNEIITADQYARMYATGASPGILYGQPKIHKPDIPLRPILAAYNTPMYNISKFLIPLIEPFSSNEYSIKNSYDFYEKVTSFKPTNNECFMVSYDISSLYTNIPVDQTLDILCNKIFTDNDLIFNEFNKKQFREILNLAVNDTNFLFNGVLYKQIGGLSMGNPIAPTLANIFLCDLEEKMLNNCPISFKPMFYKRYLDDTFVIFKNSSDSDLFFNYINNVHPNMTFTMETEQNSNLPFLDMTIQRNSNRFHSSIYRKPTFTGLGMSFF